MLEIMIKKKEKQIINQKTLKILAMKKIILIASLAAATLVKCTVAMKKNADKEILIKGFDRLNKYMKENPGKISVEVLKELMKSKSVRLFVAKHGETTNLKETQRLMREIKKRRK